MSAIPWFVRFLHQLDLRATGDGCPLAGVDSYVAMCATLSNLSHPDSSLVGPGGHTLPVGISILTVSTLSRALIEDRVVAVLRDLQDQHLRNTISRKTMRNRDERRKMTHPESWKECPTYGTGEASPMIDRRVSTLHDGVGWLNGRHESQSMAETRNRPAFFFEGHNLARLSKQFNKAHLFRPLLKLHAETSTDYASVEAVFLAIHQGIALDTDLPFHLKGEALISIDAELFRELLEHSPQLDPIARNTLWLTGTPLGNDSLVGTSPCGLARPLPSLFKSALTSLIADRLNDGPIQVRVTEEQLQACYNFTEELQALDSRFPGIAAALRPLAPSLIFGSMVLFDQHRAGKPSIYPPEVYTGLARALANRMVTFRSDAIMEGQRERLERLGRRICDRLAGGPLTERLITRKVNKLYIEECRAVMGFLLSKGAVKRVDDQWHLMPQAKGAVVEPRTLSTSG